MQLAMDKCRLYHLYHIIHSFEEQDRGLYSSVEKEILSSFIMIYQIFVVNLFYVFLV